MPEEGFNPNKSKVSDQRMATWREGEVTGKITEVPGIGPAAAKLLADHPIETERITNTYQLIGKFLMLKGPSDDDAEEGVDPKLHCSRFYYFLASRKIASHRSAIVLAIAEKCSTYFSSLYDPSLYEEDDEED